MSKRYEPKNFPRLKGLSGISDSLLQDHFKLYEGFRPIVVMDCWEHAFVPDYKATERPKYIEAWFRNVDWRACEARLIK
jgi:superoxide dismutase